MDALVWTLTADEWIEERWRLHRPSFVRHELVDTVLLRVPMVACTALAIAIPFGFGATWVVASVAPFWLGWMLWRRATLARAVWHARVLAAPWLLGPFRLTADDAVRLGTPHGSTRIAWGRIAPEPYAGGVVLGLPPGGGIHVPSRVLRNEAAFLARARALASRRPPLPSEPPSPAPWTLRYAASPGQRRALWRLSMPRTSLSLALVPAVAVTLVPLGCAAWGGSALLVALGTLPALLFVFLFAWERTGAGAAVHAALNPAAPDDGEHVMTAGPEGLRVTSASFDDRLGWKEVEATFAFEEHVLLGLVSGQVYVVPTSAFATGDVERFLVDVHRWRAT